MSEPKFSVIGKRLPKVDAMESCTGAAKYTDDLEFPGMLYGKFLRSPHQHARIRSIKTRKAENLEGVHAVITGKDLPQKYNLLSAGQEDETALATDRVRYVGDPVAAVAAVSDAVAEKALELIEVDYEVLNPVLTIEQALIPKEPANRIHESEGPGDIHVAMAYEYGNIQGGFDDSEVAFEDTFFYHGSTHVPMEELAVAAQWGPGARLTVWPSTQIPHYIHRTLSKVLGLPMDHIRVVAPAIGGGFGGKSSSCFNHHLCAAKLSMVTGRPVKIALSREECFYVQRARHPIKMWVRTGLRKDGTLRAMHFKSFLDGGGYNDEGLITTTLTGAMQPVTYKLPAYKYEAARVFTNKPPCGPKRGHGMLQPRFALEVHLDKIAEELGIDPVELRLKQLVEANSVTISGLRIASMGLGECISKAAEKAQWKKKFRQLPYGRGIGFAASGFLSGAPMPLDMNEKETPHSTVEIRIGQGGDVVVFSGATDIGQGSNSILAYAVAEELGLAPTDIRLVTSDTSLTPIDLGSYSSRVTLMTGNAALAASRKLKESLLKAASEAMEVPVDDLEMAQGEVRSKTYPEQALSFRECVERAESKFGALSATGSYKPPADLVDFSRGVFSSPAFSYTATIAELSCDPETAQVKIDKVWIAHDCGRAFNPMLVEGQLEGSVYMGVGEALMEEQAFRKNGLHQAPSLLDYKTPTTLDSPEIECIIVETHDPGGPYGAKECGEGPILSVVPAIANALYDAVGVRMYEVPMTPDKILRAMQKRLKPPTVPPFDFPEPVRCSPAEK